MPDVRAKAQQLYKLWDDDPSKADRDIAPALVSILAYSGDAARYDEFKKKFKVRAHSAGGATLPVRARELPRQVTAPCARWTMSLDGEVRTQNAPYLMHSLLLNNSSRYDAWDFIRSHWDEMTRKYPDNALPRMCEGVVSLLDREDEVKKFFQEHRVRLGGKIIDQHLERLAIAVNFRRREGAKLSVDAEGRLRFFRVGALREAPLWEFLMHHAARVRLRMPEDRMRLVGLFESRDLLGAQFDLDRLV